MEDRPYTYTILKPILILYTCAIVVSDSLWIRQEFFLDNIDNAGNAVEKTDYENSKVTRTFKFTLWLEGRKWEKRMNQGIN